MWPFDLIGDGKQKQHHNRLMWNLVVWLRIKKIVSKTHTSAMVKSTKVSQKKVSKKLLWVNPELNLVDTESGQMLLDEVVVAPKSRKTTKRHERPLNSDPTIASTPTKTPRKKILSKFPCKYSIYFHIYHALPIIFYKPKFQKYAESLSSPIPNNIT